MLFRFILGCVFLFGGIKLNSDTVDSKSAQIAILDMDKVLSSLNEVRELNQKIERLKMEYEMEYKEKSKKLELAYDQIKKENPKTDDEKSKVADRKLKLDKQKQDLNEEAKSKYGEFTTLIENKMQQLQQKIMTASQKISDEKNIIIVPSQWVVTYPANHLDFTKQIVEAVNKEGK